MISIRFVLIREGSSDNGLIPHLENLCVEVGADEVMSAAFDHQRIGTGSGSTVEAKLRAVLHHEPNANLIFIHRDADRRDSTPRHNEVASAIDAVSPENECVCVVPVQETEAWILLDDAAIRRVAGRLSGKVPLSLPKPSQVEFTANPKERLQQALLLAADLTGRKRDRFRAEFPSHRQLLLERLPTGGALNEVPSWVRLRDDLSVAVHRIAGKTSS